MTYRRALAGGRRATGSDVHLNRSQRHLLRLRQWAPRHRPPMPPSVRAEGLGGSGCYRFGDRVGTRLGFALDNGNHGLRVHKRGRHIRRREDHPDLRGRDRGRWYLALPGQSGRELGDCSGGVGGSRIRSKSLPRVRLAGRKPLCSDQCRLRTLALPYCVGRGCWLSCCRFTSRSRSGRRIGTAGIPWELRKVKRTLLPRARRVQPPPPQQRSDSTAHPMVYLG